MSWSHVQSPSPAGAQNVATLNLAITGVTAGDLLVVLVGSVVTGAGPPTVTDSGGNTYTFIGGFTQGSNGGDWFYSTVATGGNLTVTAHTASGTSYMTLGVSEYAVATFSTISLVNSKFAQGSSSTLTTPNCSFAGTGNFLLIGAGATQGNTSPSIHAPYTQRYAGNPSNAGCLMSGDQFLAGTSSPQSATISVATSTQEVAACIAFLETTHNALNVTPNVAGESDTTAVSALAFGTSWLSGPTPLFSITGVAGCSITSIVVLTDTTATFNVVSSTTAGAATIHDLSNTNTAAFTIETTQPGFTISPAAVPINIGQPGPNPPATAPAVLTVTGNYTSWSSGVTTFTASGVAGVTVTAAILGPTSATLTVTTLSGTGTVTVSDGLYSSTFGVLGGVIAQAYVARSGNMAYFVTAPAFDTYAPLSAPVPTYSVTGVTVTNGGSSYTTPTAAITGGVALTLVDGGSGYTSAPTVSLSGGGGGTGASATATLASGIALTLTNGGSGYTTWPTVAISGGSGSGASALATGGVALTVTNGGSGFASPPVVTIAGTGSGAAAFATISGGVVTALTVITPGYGYASGATVTMSGNGGSGATGVVSLAGNTVGGFLVTPGSGYIGGAVPTVAITGAGGSGATATAWIPSGCVSGFTVTAGTGYTANPIVTLTGGGGSGALATAAVTSMGGAGCVLGPPVVASGVITGIPVVMQGTGYTAAPPIAIIGGGGSSATATAVLAGATQTPFGSIAVRAVNAQPTIKVNGSSVALAMYVSGAPVSACGNGYLPVVTIAAPGGSGVTATATPFINGSGGIGLNLQNNGQSGGSGYGSAPTVTITGGNGTGASATANIAGGSVVSFNVTPGSGYSFPTLTLSGGSGTGATGSVNLTPTGGIGLTLTSGGSGYTAAPIVTIGQAPNSQGNAFANAAINAAGAVIGFSVNPGFGYLAPPAVTIAGGGGTGAAATATVGVGQVQSANILLPGSGYLPGDTVTGTVSAPSSGVTAAVVPVIGPPWGLGNGEPFVPYQLLCGGVASVLVQKPGAGYTTPVVTPTGGGGSGLVLASPAVVNGVIVSVPIASAGTNYHARTLYATDSTGVGIGFIAGANPTSSPGPIASVLIESGGHGYTDGHTSIAFSSISNDGGGGASFTNPTLSNGGLVNGAIGGVAVTTAGTGYTSAPALAVTDGTTISFTGTLTSGSAAVTTISSTSTLIVGQLVTGTGIPAATTIIAIVSGTAITLSANATANGAQSLSATGHGAVVVPIMTGPLSTDTVTYTGQAGWITTQAGAVPAATNAPMFNFAGQLEPAFANVPKTMGLSVNMMSPFGYEFQAVNQNWLKGINSWFGCNAPGTSQTGLNASGATVTAAVTTGSASVTLSGSPTNANPLNQLCWFAGDSSGGLYTFTAGSGTSWTITPSFSGGNLAAATVFVANSRSLAVSNGANDSTGQSAQALAVVNAAGQIASVTVVSGGCGYTAAPKVTMPAPHAGGTLSTGWTATISGGIVTAIAGGTAGSGYGGQTNDSHPISLNSFSDVSGTTDTVPHAGAAFSYCSNENNQTDTQGTPDQAGVWTFTADEHNPSNPMVVSVWSQANSTFYTATPSAGTMTGGVAVGKVWSFNVPRQYRFAGSVGPIWNLSLFLDIAAPSATISNGAAPYSLTNEFLTSPQRGSALVGNAANRATPMAPDLNVLSRLKVSATGANTTSVRCWPFPDFQWNNNVVDAADLRAPTDFTWWDSGQRNAFFLVAAIRAYQPWSGSAFTGTTTNGSPTVTSITSTAGMAIGQAVTGAGIPDGTIVSAIPNGTTLTLSHNATSSGTGTLGYSSPYIYTNNNFTGTQLTSGNGAAVAAWGSGTAPLYYWTPPGNTSGNNVQWMGKAAGSTQRSFCCEFVTYAPHGIKFGQQFICPGSSLSSFLPCVDANNATPGTIVHSSGLTGQNYPLTCFVTSATTFAVQTQFNGDPFSPGPSISNVAGSNPSTPPFGVNIGLKGNGNPQNGGSPPGPNAAPYEAFAGLAAAIPGCGLHTFVPTFASDACIAQIAADIRDIIPVGRKVYPQFINEHWNQISPNYQDCFAMASLFSTGSICRVNQGDDFYTLRASQVHKIFVDTFNATDINGNTNRGNSIVRIYGVQAETNNDMLGFAGFANRYNAGNPATPIRIDAFMAAPYLDYPQDPNTTAIAASLYSSFPGSIMYLSRTPWTMGMYADLFRHYAYYGTAWMIGNSCLNSGYQLPPGQAVQPWPMTYEASIQRAIPVGTTPNDFAMSAYLSHDLFFHPYYYDACTGFHAGVQFAGTRICTDFCDQQFRSIGGPSTTILGTTDQKGVALWPSVTWPGMAWGVGDGSTDSNGNATVNATFKDTGNAQDLLNVSGRVASFRDWIAATFASPAMTASVTTLATSATTTVLLTGSNTSWVGGTTASISGVAGCSIASQSINTTTQVMTLSIVTGSTAGTLLVTNSTDAGTATIMVSTGIVASVLRWLRIASSPRKRVGGRIASRSKLVAAATPTMSASPGSIPQAATTTVLVSGSFTSWTSGTTASISGVAGCSIASQSVNVATQVLTLSIVTGSPSGTLTITDSTDAASTTVTVTSVAPAMTPSPASIPQASTSTVTLTGARTLWTSGTTAAISGVPGCSITSQSVNVASQVMTLSILTGVPSGVLTATDTTDSATAAITVTNVPPVVAASPGSIPQNATTTVTLTGTRTLWTSGTTASISGVAGTSIASQSINVGTQVITLSVVTGSPSGTLAVTDSTDSASTTVTVTSVPPVVLASPSSIPQASTTTVTLTGTRTLWTSGTTASISGVAGTSIASQSINVGTQVITLSIVTGSPSGTLTLSDSTDAATTTIMVTSVAPVITASPASIPQSSTTAVTLTGTRTLWTSGTTASISGVAGCSIASQSINVGTQVITLSIVTGASVGTLTIGDSTDAATAAVTVTSVAAPMVSASPGSIPTSTTTTVLLTGTNTTWDSGTTAAISGLAGASISSQGVDATTQVITLAIATGSAFGSLVISDSTDSATATIVVVMPAISASRTWIPISTTTTVTVRGVNTAWTMATTASISGVAGCSIVSQSINTSTQVMTLSIATGATMGILTISDSTDAATVTTSVQALTSSPSGPTKRWFSGLFRR